MGPGLCPRRTLSWFSAWAICRSMMGSWARTDASWPRACCSSVPEAMPPFIWARTSAREASSDLTVSWVMARWSSRMRSWQ